MAAPGNIWNLVSNMGMRYVAYRGWHEVSRRFGLLKKKFPVAPPFRQYITLNDWKSNNAQFFFANRESLSFPKNLTGDIQTRFRELQQGNFTFFNATVLPLGTNYDWVTNPDTGHKYDIGKHWTEIPDYSKEAGDIKYVWEKSRFSYLYDIIRYDYHSGTDCSALVFGDILSWIHANPINCGPNYRCSQEMSLRFMNWMFALHYYRNSPALTADVFAQIQHVLYWHLHHIYNHIHFSRIAVRNNHAITETLALYLGGTFFPSMPGAATWKKQGRKWFVQEIAYQVYEDGTYLQFSMNYHRVVVQLLTWATVLAEKNNDRLPDIVYSRAAASLRFLRTCMADDSGGMLPNYGANDGALFFRLSSTHYRDYRPQLQALAFALGIAPGIDSAFEDAAWYGLSGDTTGAGAPATDAYSFPDGGYYILREPDTLTFIKCGGYKDRPSQADNLHLDIWYRGQNILADAGSYKYNTDNDTIRYFSGTRSHNTVMVGDFDQMLKGGRFIWYYWTRLMNVRASLSGKQYSFSGSIEAFRHVGSAIIHTRTIHKTLGQPEWKITDHLTHTAGATIQQLWHIPAHVHPLPRIEAADAHHTALHPVTGNGWISELYGVRTHSTEISFATTTDSIETLIRL